MTKLVQPAFYLNDDDTTRIKVSKVRVGSGNKRKKDKTYLLWNVYPSLKYSDIDLELYPIVVTYDGRLCDGLCRLRTAQAMGIEDLPCVVKG